MNAMPKQRCYDHAFPSSTGSPLRFPVSSPPSSPTSESGPILVAGSATLMRTRWLIPCRRAALNGVSGRDRWWPDDLPRAAEHDHVGAYDSGVPLLPPAAWTPAGACPPGTNGKAPDPAAGP